MIGKPALRVLFETEIARWKRAAKPRNSAAINRQFPLFSLNSRIDKLGRFG